MTKYSEKNFVCFAESPEYCKQQKGMELFVEAGFVTKPAHWKYSSACNYTGELGIIELDEL